MVIDTQLLQEKCKKILGALGAKNGIDDDTLELKAVGNVLYMNVTDKTYFVSVQMPLAEPEEFAAVVNATKFLNFISITTTKTITMKTTSNYLQIKGNGNYKLPLIYNGDKLVELPRIEIDNVTSEFNIKNYILQSILKYNDKILYTSGCRLPIFYVDNKGAITLSRSACINSFELAQPVSLILSEKLVKLFKLFKSEEVSFKMGFDERPDGLTQQKVLFTDGSVVLTAILTTDTQVLNNFPVKGIRDRAERLAPYSAVIDKELLADAIDRLSIFSNIESAVYMKFDKDGVFVSPEKLEGASDPVGEKVDFVNECLLLEDTEYFAKFNVEDLSLILKNWEDKYVTLSFGDKALSISKDNIKNMLPECR